MSGTLSGTDYVYVKSGQTRHNLTVAPVSVSGQVDDEQEVLEVQYRATVIGTKVYSGGFVYLHSGAVASATQVISGGDEQVFQGAKAFGTVLNGATTDRASQDVFGAAKNTIVDSGGLSYAASGGVISASVVKAGGFEYAFLGGKTIGATVSAGGIEGGAGQLVSTTVSNGGYAYVSATGVASASVIHGGGQEVVFKGAIEKDTVIDGGLVVLNAGAKTAGTITFDGSGGELEIKGGKMPKAVLTDFAAGDEVKLAGIKYSKTDTVTVISAGVVEITAGTKEYKLHIAGAEVGDSAAFHFGPGSILTTTAPAMAFLTPVAAAAPAEVRLPAAVAPEMAVKAAEAAAVLRVTLGLVARDEWFGGKPAGYALLSGHAGSF